MFFSTLQILASAFVYIPRCLEVTAGVCTLSLLFRSEVKGQMALQESSSSFTVVPVAFYCFVSFMFYCMILFSRAASEVYACFFSLLVDVTLWKAKVFICLTQMRNGRLG